MLLRVWVRRVRCRLPRWKRRIHGLRLRWRVCLCGLTRLLLCVVRNCAICHRRSVLRVSISLMIRILRCVSILGHVGHAGCLCRIWSISVLSRSSLTSCSFFISLTTGVNVLFGQERVVSLDCHHEPILHFREHFCEEWRVSCQSQLLQIMALLTLLRSLLLNVSC